MNERIVGAFLDVVLAEDVLSAGWEKGERRELRGVLTRILGEVVSEPHHHFVALSITRDVVEVRLRREDLRK